MKATLKRSLSTAMAAAMLFSACSSGASSSVSAPASSAAPASSGSQAASQSSESAPAPEKPIKLSITTTTFSTDALNENSPVFVKLQELTNSDLEINFIPDSAYKEKLSAMIAGNTLPDVLYLPDMTTNTTVTALEAGVFWELGDYIPDYPNLAQGSEEGWLRASVEGKIYGIYRERDIARLGVQYRKDWAEKVGITKAPETIDEFYDMCVKFTKEDPDGNGVDDTIAVSFQSSMASMCTILSWFGAGPGKNYELVDGEIRHVAMGEGYYEGLRFIRKLYEEGLCNQDFISVKQRSDNFRAGKAGILLSAVTDAVGNKKELVKLIPDAEIAIGNIVDAGYGLNAAADTSGYKGFYVFPTTVVKTEERLRECLTFFDRMNTKEVNDLLSYGIEGVDYSIEDGLVVRTEAQKDQHLTDVNGLAGLQTLNLTVNVKSDEKMDELDTAIEKQLRINEQYVRPSATSGLVSAASSKLGGELGNIINDAQAKYIMGQISEDELRAAVAQWRAQGGDQVLKEYNESYQKAIAQ